MTKTTISLFGYKEGKINLDSVVLLLLYVFAFLGMINSSIKIISMGVVSLCMIILTLCGQITYVFPVAIIINDDLGSIPGGFSIYFVFMFCYVLDIVFFEKSRELFLNFSWQKLVYWLFAVFINMQLFLTDSASWQRMIIGAFSMIWGYDTIKKVIQKEELDVFLKQCSITITMAVAASALIGYEETFGGAYGNEIVRAGLLGQGSGGDPNFAGMTIIVGIIMCFMSSWKTWQKIVWCSALMFGLIRTVSLTAFGVLIAALLVFYFLLSRHKAYSWRGRAFVLTTIIVVITVFIYQNAELIGSEFVVSYRDRIKEAFQQLSVGDWNDVSSERESIVKMGMDYYFRQGLTAKLFGGNSCFVLGPATHNTYLEQLLRFGAVGLIGITLVLIGKLISLIRRYYQRKLVVPDRIGAGAIALKIVMLLYCFTLAINGGCALVVWSVVLLCV